MSLANTVMSLASSLFYKQEKQVCIEPSIGPPVAAKESTPLFLS